MKTTSGMRKYYIGLTVIGLFAVGVLIFVLTLASANKQDVATDNSANTIANKLNSYIETNSIVPSSLGAAGITNVPSSISYTKLSDDSYKFCATYRSSGTDLMANSLDSTSIGQLAISAAQGSSLDQSTTAPNELFINFTHKKGQNCQTITPGLLSSGGVCNASAQLCGSGATGASVDEERKTDAAGILSAVSGYVSNTGGMPAATDITNLDGNVTIGTDPTTQVFAQLNYYTQSSQFVVKQFAAGDTNTTDTSANDNLILELGASCSGANPAAGPATSSVVLYSTQADGRQCLAS